MGKDFSRRAMEIDPQEKPARLHLRTWMQGIVDEEALSMPKATDFDRRFDSSGGTLPTTHVGMYVGGDQFIHASTTSYRVQYDSIYGYYAPYIVGAKRIG